jgi:large repetitive protein
MRRALLIVLAAVLMSMAFATVSMAQDGGIDSQMFRPSIFGGHYVALEGAHTHWDLCYGLGLYANYANSPVEIRIEDEFDRGVLDSVTSANAIAMFTPWWWWGMGVDVPFHAQSRGYEFDDIETGAENDTRVDNAMLGDIKAEMKFSFTRMEQQYVGIALAPFAHFPTGNPDMFLGEGVILPGGKLLLEVDAKIFYIVANGGYAFRDNRTVLGTDVGSAYLFGAGISREFGGLGFSIEYTGQTFDSSSNDSLQANPMEVLGTLRYRFGNGLRVLGGGGMGLTSGVGAPAYRMLAGVDYFPDCIPPTTGFLQVQVIDSDNNPLKAALVVKKVKSHNTDTNSAGFYSSEANPGEYKISASVEGYVPATETGLVKTGKTTKIVIMLYPIPKPTVLTVTVVHKKSQNPIAGAGILIKEVESGKLAGQKAADGTWSSEYLPGTYIISGLATGYERVDAEFTVEPQKVNTLKIDLRKKIIKIGKVQFAFDSAELLPTAFPVLDDVVRKIEETDIVFKKLIVEGHTSSEGSDEYNLKLSKRRATSVMNYLIKKGIKADLLDIAPFGESRPIADNETEEGKETNRRSEFIFEE